MRVGQIRENGIPNHRMRALREGRETELGPMGEVRAQLGINSHM